MWPYSVAVGEMQPGATGGNEQWAEAVLRASRPDC